MKISCVAILVFGYIGTLCGCGKTENGPPATDAAVPTATFSVCELMANLRAYQGKMVSVRGIYFWGLRQNGCAKPFMTGANVWPAALEAVETGDKSADGFSTDLKSLRDLYALVRREGQLGKREEIWVTIVGRIKGPVMLDQRGREYFGFGHLGQVPAALVIERIENIEIRPSPTYNYKDLLYQGPL